MVSMRIFGGGGALELLFHDHRERKLAASCLRATRGLEGKGRLFFLYFLYSLLCNPNSNLTNNGLIARLIFMR